MWVRFYPAMMGGCTVVGTGVGLYHNALHREPYALERALVGGAWGFLTGAMYPIMVPYMTYYYVTSHSSLPGWRQKAERLASKDSKVSQAEKVHRVSPYHSQTEDRCSQMDQNAPRRD
jgi:hypothetical protein